MNYKTRAGLYLAAKIAVWVFCGLVGLGITDMLITYFQPGRGVASPWGMLDVTDLVLNAALWGGPAIFLLVVVHSPAVKNWFVKNSDTNK